MIDLRSDTVTRPTPEMRRAMADASVGDDVFGEDPTVNALQEKSAELLGKEAALFVPSGTMGNLISLLSHCPNRGAEILLGDQSHIFFYEQGGASSVGSLVYHTIPTNPDGTLPLDQIQSAARDRANVHYAPPGLLCLENTHNRCGGAVLPISYLHDARKIATTIGIPMHLDGARLANAAVALNVPLKDIAAPFDSIQFDLSKALGSPVGGIVAGSRDFISRAKRNRKLLGGGMRQAGIIAAAGLISLTMIDRLADDHRLAKRLAGSLAEIKGLRIDLAAVQTNIVIVYLESMPAPDFVAALKSAGVLAGSPGPGRIRFVTHYDLSAADIDTVIATVRQITKPA
ncbi:MAG TPA: low-specificity L-threonine aldolase [Tepidisphaeraceae bacterium]|jgi:threonine aldolase|nr:low-specificity L-threonine aldolase [Tepidisphaeraceae bacterium]